MADRHPQTGKMNAEDNPRRIVLLDRDGVINRDSPDFIKSWKEFEFIPGSLEALRRLNETGHEVIVVTNQSGVARGLIAPETLETMHRNLKAAAAAAGGHILDIFYCPHGPHEGCRCRKPAVGLVEQARRRYPFDPTRSVLVGDSLRDIRCGLRAGCAVTVLVRTGKGEAALAAMAETDLRVDHCADNLRGAVEWIISHFPAATDTRSSDLAKPL